MQNFNNYGMQGCGAYNYVQPPKNEYAFVDGVEGARAYQVRPNSTMLLMDSQQPMCYKKQTDFTGRTISFEIYDLIPHQDKPQVEYVTREEFNELKALIEKSGNNA